MLGLSDERLVLEDTRLLPPGYQTVQVSDRLGSLRTRGCCPLAIRQFRSVPSQTSGLSDERLVLEDTRLLPPDYETV